MEELNIFTFETEAIMSHKAFMFLKNFFLRLSIASILLTCVTLLDASTFKYGIGMLIVAIFTTIMAMHFYNISKDIRSTEQDNPNKKYYLTRHQVFKKK